MCPNSICFGFKSSPYKGTLGPKSIYYLGTWTLNLGIRVEGFGLGFEVYRV